MRQELAILWPTLARYALMVAAGWFANRGLLSEYQADSIANEPALIDFAAAMLSALVALVWYWWSKARKAVKRWWSE